MVLRNDYDKEFCIDNLEEAKNNFRIEEPNEDVFIGDNFAVYVASYKNYIQDLERAESLEDVADVVNSYTDTFGNGSQYYVSEV